MNKINLCNLDDNFQILDKDSASDSSIIFRKINNKDIVLKIFELTERNSGLL